MLADNFKTAAELGLLEVEHQALITVLRMLERGEIAASSFDMTSLCRCICGFSHFASNGAAFPEVSGPPNALLIRLPESLQRLFMFRKSGYPLASSNIKPPQAAVALRDYLRTGEERWSEALAA